MTNDNQSNVMADKRMWIGLFFGHITDDARDLFGGARHAGVNVVGLASSRPQFLELVEQELAELGIVLKEYEDVEPLEARMQEYELDDSLRQLIEPARMSGRIQLGTIHVTDDDS